MHRDKATAEVAVVELFESILASRYLHVHVPHGFTVAALDSEERENPFTAVLRHVRVNATVDAPVVYKPLNGRAHTADREILDALKAWIEQLAANRGRIDLVDWQVRPVDDPDPRNLDEPDQRWTITAAFDVH
jgi:hypothetical protein